jgi:hypothetical protein
VRITRQGVDVGAKGKGRGGEVPPLLIPGSAGKARQSQCRRGGGGMERLILILLRARGICRKAENYPWPGFEGSGHGDMRVGAAAGRWHGAGPPPSNAAQQTRGAAGAAAWRAGGSQMGGARVSRPAGATRKRASLRAARARCGKQIPGTRGVAHCLAPPGRR